ncbi:cell wall-binding repeat-containing protein [Clostridium magnum]|uniref:N-acetylmuramoyl-L-alanine amidase LytC n=1 Tax=Clostridium magnum DSM 2767 TaxID=1121326 RepID=A0A161Y6Z8_9CLOT|nr:cell wall-binding repeat-containing protein [Clostridium magnum]KZL94129.1 N-acetylmuramoyl-L-alanine amidase LytC precursor [Clostridium magnum DSM 2767]SHH94517.1 Ig-like domain (group 4) [Clostridium magnum DSM 2767]
MKSSRFANTLISKKITIMVLAVIIGTAVNFTKVHAASIANRYNGVNRYETAAKVSQDGWQEDTDYAVIVNGENFPDAMSAAPLAKKYEAPILLTDKDLLSPYTSVEINRLNVKNIFIIGGKGVVSQSIEDALKARGMKVTRLGGVDRYETGILVAQKLGKPSQIAVVNGADFHDGMSIASIAALKGMPIILTGVNTIPDSVKKYLKANSKIEQAYVIGGKAQISDSVMSFIPNAKRVGEGSVYERNAAIINAFQNEISTGTIFVASAKDFPDSLVASSIAPKTASPILYVDSPMAQATEDLLKSKIVKNIKILGGTGVVGYDTEYTLGYMPLDIAYVEDFTDVIWQNQKYTPRPTVIVTATDGTIKEVPVSWNLIKVVTSKPGVYTLYGKIYGTDRTIVTTLIIKPLPVKVEDTGSEVNIGDEYTLPETISAKMSDGTVSKVDVSWEYGNQDTSNPGIYTFYGTVEKYSKKVKFTLVVKDNGNGNTSNDQFDDTVIEIVQGEAYTLPKTVLDKISNKNLPVTWSTKSIDTSQVGIVRLQGTVQGSIYKAYLTLIVTPKIVDVLQITETVVQGSYFELPTEVAAKTSDNRIIYVPVTWDSPFIDLGTPQTYYLKGTVNHYKMPVVLMLKVVSN